MVEVVLKGIPISEGIAMGEPFFLHSEEKRVSEFSITIGEVDEEIARYREALFSSKKDLKALKSRLEEESSDDAVTIIDSHIQMLDDPLITEHTEERIRQDLQRPERVLQSVLNEYENRFSQKRDLFFKERLTDVMDLAHRVLGHLCPSEGSSLSYVPLNSIVFAKELIPSQIAAVDPSRVAAFVTVSMGGNCHTALMARAKGIPYVGGVELTPWTSFTIGSVLVDGQTGEVVLNPLPQTLKKYQLKKKRQKISVRLLQKEQKHPLETLDGYPAFVYANVGQSSEWETVKKSHPHGVGLFRSEYLCFERRHLLESEEEQYDLYTRLVRSMKGLPIVIRAFDLGGDKTLQLRQEQEVNPALGCRGIRFLLRHPDLFCIQLRALLRAAVGADVRLLLPFVSDPGQLIAAKQLVNEVLRSLKGIPHREQVPLGCMIELPSAALLCDELAKQCDFFSVGTNDLAQYTLGIDRQHPFLGHLCHSIHPGVLRLLKRVALQANRVNKEITLCGEMASNGLCIPLLLGLGFHRFSCSPRYIPSVKKVIRCCTRSKVVQLADQVLELGSVEEVMTALERFASNFSKSHGANRATTF